MLVDRGEVDAARRLFASTMASVSTLARDLLYVWTVTLLAECAVALGDPEAGEVLYELLLPFADRFVVAAGGVVCLGSASHQLGQLAALDAWPDAAQRHLTTALAAHRRANSTALAAASEAALAALSPASVAFDLDGQVVTVRYGPEVARLPSSLGLRYLSLLAANPGLEIDAVRLVALASGLDDDRALRDGPATLGPPDEVLDKTALASYRTRLAELDDELDEAATWQDHGRTALLAEERDHLLAELSRAVGLGGRTRRFTDESERARVNVTRAIRAAIRKIKAQSTPLGAHLDQCVTTGGRCRYDPPTG